MRFTLETKGLRRTLVLGFLVVGWGLGVAVPALCEEGKLGPKTLTLQEATNVAMNMNPTVFDALDALEIAHSNLVLAQQGTFDPTVTISGQWGVVEDLESGMEISIQDTIPISGIGKKPVAQERAEIALAQAEHALNVTRQDAVHQVITAYFAVLRAERMVETAQLAEEIALFGYRDTRVLLDQGNASQQDLWQAEQGYLEAQASTVQLASGLMIHQKRLGLVIGVALDDPVSLQTEFIVLRTPPDRSVYIEFAREHHPTLLNLVFDREGAGVSLEEVLEARRLNIGLVGSLVEDQWSLSLKTRNPEWDLDWEIRGRFFGDDTLSAPGDSFAPSSSGWGAGIEVSWVPFDGGVGRERERQERIKLERIERSIRSRGEQVELEIEEAIQAVLDAENRLVLSELGLKIEEENILVRGKQLEQGFIADREYLHSEYQLALARMNHDAAVFDLILSRVRLEQASGREIRLETMLET